MQHPTIAAISTPPGHGGIGIIKLSGPAALPIALSIFKPHNNAIGPKTEISSESSPDFPQSHRLYYGHVFSGDFKQALDEALFVLMRGPHSHTGEDVVEIQTHGGPIVLHSILNTLLHKGAHLAEAGEFTRRAFLNGRTDLTQAEAVIDLINAQSIRSAQLAASMITGDLKNEILFLRDSLWNLLTTQEAAIDFPDEVEIDSEYASALSILDEVLIPNIQSLINRYNELNFLRTGLSIVIVGRPNVGKSSLMNRLVNTDRSIVTDIPGTTRDFIEDAFIHNGISIVVADTAGIRDNPDAIEQIGIEKAWGIISKADIVLLTLDASRKMNDADVSLFEHLAKKRKIIVINKSDLPNEQTRLSIPDNWQQEETIRISALYNQGIDLLKDKIAQLGVTCEPGNTQKIVPNLRQKLCLEKTIQSLMDAREGLLQQLPIEVVCIDLRAAFENLLEITGESIKPDVLDTIFGRFCIGK